jgi:C-terminal processing protease CtpA/Prc
VHSVLVDEEAVSCGEIVSGFRELRKKGRRTDDFDSDSADLDSLKSRGRWLRLTEGQGARKERKVHLVTTEVPLQQTRNDTAEAERNGEGIAVVRPLTSVVVCTGEAIKT